MKCRDLMQPVCSCPASANVMRVAAIMRDTNCGAAAIVAAEGKPVGLIIDRDLTTQIAPTGKDCYYMPATELAQKATSCMADEDARERRNGSCTLWAGLFWSWSRTSPLASFTFLSAVCRGTPDAPLLGLRVL